jgi:hypothetical protein
MKRSIAVASLICVFCSASFAVVHFSIDAPQDDREARARIGERPELQGLYAEYSNLIKTRLWPLKLGKMANIFGPQLDTATNWWGLDADEGGKRSGPKLEHHPTDLVLPIFVPQGMMVSGLHNSNRVSDRSHTDLHAVGDIGYVEIYYQHDGESVQTAAIYFRADKKFVPLKSTNDFSKRLDWDKGKFEALKNWLDAHPVPVTDTNKSSPNATSAPEK